MLFPLVSNAGIIGEDVIWKSNGIKDLNGNDLSNKIEQFVTHNSKELLLCNILVRPDLTTGEPNFEITIDTFKIEKTNGELNAVGNKFTFKLEVNSEDDMRLYTKGYYFSFSTAPEVKKNNFDAATLREKMLNKSYLKSDIETGNAIDGLVRTVGKSSISFENTRGGSSTSYPYQIFNFDGYVILKNSNEPSFILNEIKEEQINFHQIQRNKSAELTSWKLKK